MTKAKKSTKKTATKRPATKRARVAMATNQTYYKVLRDGCSWHGGEWEWSLPTPDGKGGYTPGEWHDAGEPVLCTSGLHLTSKPSAWWGDGATAFVAEYDGRTDGPGDGDKIAVERCRLLRPATHEELAATGLYLSGEHHAYGNATIHASGNATVHASGNATVRAYDSATIHASGNATVHAYGNATVHASDSAIVRAVGGATVHASDSATVHAYDSATVHAYDSAIVRAYDSAIVRASDSATVHASDSATVHAYGNATVHASDSAIVRAYDSATVRASDSATVIATAYTGATAVYELSNSAVLVDRRGNKPTCTVAK